MPEPGETDAPEVDIAGVKLPVRSVPDGIVKLIVWFASFISVLPICPEITNDIICLVELCAMLIVT